MGRRRRAADQRRPDLPPLPRDDPLGAADDLPAHVRLLARGDRRRRRRRALRAGARGRGVQRDHRRDGRHEARADVIERMLEAGVRVSQFRPPKPYAMRRLGNRTHRKILVADGARRADGRRRHRGGVDGQRRRTPTTGATPTCASAARSCAGCSAPSPRTGWRRRARCWSATATCPSSSEGDGGGPMMVVRSSAGVGDTNVEALYYLAIAAARGRST